MRQLGYGAKGFTIDRHGTVAPQRGNMNKSLFITAALAGGFVLPIQVAINTLLKRHIGQPMQVTFVSYVAGALGALLICVIARYPLPAAAAISGTSWWMWFAGCLGTIYVWSTMIETI